MKTYVVSFASLVMILTITGCEAGLDQRSFASRVIPAAAPDEVFLAGQTALRREFPRLLVESGARRLDMAPVEYQSRSDSGSARDLYGGTSRLRRTGHYSVSQRGEGSVARLRIDVEREDTRRREVFQPQADRLTDQPSRTPIERDAATSTEQNTVWTFVRRDMRLERALLAEIEEQFADADEPPTPAPVDTERAGEPSDS